MNDGRMLGRLWCPPSYVSYISCAGYLPQSARISYVAYEAFIFAFVYEAISAELESEGSLQEFGLRLCGVLSALGEGHFKCFSQQGDRRNLFLQQVLMVILAIVSI